MIENVYPSLMENLLSGNFADFTGEDYITCALLDETGTYDSADSSWTDVSDSEIADEDYSPVTLTNVTVTEDEGVITLNADTIDFGTEVTITASNAVLYADGNLIMHFDFEGEQSSENGNFQIEVPDGLIEWSV